MWDDFWAALALVLVIEGMLPFLNPGGWRRLLLTLTRADDRSLRIAGLVFMLAGVALLYWVRGDTST